MTKKRGRGQNKKANLPRGASAHRYYVIFAGALGTEKIRAAILRKESSLPESSSAISLSRSISCLGEPSGRGGANREPRETGAVPPASAVCHRFSEHGREVSVRTLKNPREDDDNGETRCLCGYRFPRILSVTFSFTCAPPSALPAE